MAKATFFLVLFFNKDHPFTIRGWIFSKEGLTTIFPPARDGA